MKNKAAQSVFCCFITLFYMPCSVKQLSSIAFGQRPKLVVLVFCEKDFNDKIMSNKLDQGVVVMNVLICDETIFICSRIFFANSIIIDNNHSLAKFLEIPSCNFKLKDNQ